MKAFLLGLFLVPFLASADCGLKVERGAVIRAQVVSLAEASDEVIGFQGDCASALVEITKLDRFKLPEPVLYSQAFTPETSTTLSLSALLAETIPRLIVISYVFEGELLTVRLIHKDFMDVLDQ